MFHSNLDLCKTCIIPIYFLQNPDFRLQMLLGHLVPHRYLKPELYQTESIQTQANTTLSVSTNSSGVNSKSNFRFIGFFFELFYIKTIAWEPSAAKVTKSYSRRLPALDRFYRETKFSLLKSTHST